MADSPFISWTLNLRTTSPLFLGGADANDHAELRPPSIKGAVRAWYRRLVSIDTAWRREGALFGGVAQGQGQSPLSLRLAGGPLTGEEPWAARRVPMGLSYLGYSLVLGANDRKAIPADRELRVAISGARQRVDEEVKRAWVGALWCMCHLGGLGSRSRRGLGSLCLEGWSGLDEEGRALPLLASGRTKAELCQRLERGLKTLEGWYPDSTGRTTDEPDLCPTLFGAQARVLLGPPSPTWQEALDALGLEFMGWRRQTGDGFPTLRMLKEGRPLPGGPRRTAFGLPLAYYDKRDRKTFVMVPVDPAAPRQGSRGPSEGGAEEQLGRMPSPLLFHLQRTQAGVVPIVTRLHTPEGLEELPVRERRGRGALQRQEGSRALDAFCDHLINLGFVPAWEARR